MDGNNLKILVVEDHKLAQKMAKLSIEPLEFEVDIVDTGTEAISRFQNTHYDFVFVDLGLPDVDGYTVTETIREIEVRKQMHYTPIVALTVHAENEFIQNALKSGMDDFLSKPLTTEKAKAIIDKYTRLEN